jgi:hypothetical protein
MIYKKKYICRLEGNMIPLWRSLYGLKLYPCAWFHHYMWEILRNVDHTSFYKRNGSKIAILIVYVDDIVFT